MASNRKKIPLAIRDLVIPDWKGDQNSKMSLMQIAKYKLVNQLCRKIIYNFKIIRSIPNKRGRGRKRILKNREVHNVLQQLNKFGSLPGKTISCQVKDMPGKKTSLRTIPRTLNKENLKSRIAVGKLYISKKNATKNMKFARDHIFEDKAL